MKISFNPPLFSGISVGSTIAKIIFYSYRHYVSLFAVLLVFATVLAHIVNLRDVIAAQSINTFIPIQLFLGQVLIARSASHLALLGNSGVEEAFPIPLFWMTRPIKTPVLATWILTWINIASVSLWAYIVLFVLYPLGIVFPIFSSLCSMLLLSALSTTVAWMWCLLPLPFRKQVSASLIVMPLMIGFYFISMSSFYLTNFIYDAILAMGVVVVSIGVGTHCLIMLRRGVICFVGRNSALKPQMATKNHWVTSKKTSVLVANSMLGLFNSSTELFLFSGIMTYQGYMFSGVLSSLAYLPMIGALLGANIAIQGKSGVLLSFFTIRPTSNNSWAKAIGLTNLIRSVLMWSCFLIGLIFSYTKLGPEKHFTTDTVTPYLFIFLFTLCTWKLQMTAGWLTTIHGSLLLVLMPFGLFALSKNQDFLLRCFSATAFILVLLVARICMLSICLYSQFRCKLLSAKRAVNFSLIWLSLIVAFGLFLSLLIPNISVLSGITLSACAMPLSSIFMLGMVFKWKRHGGTTIESARDMFVR